MVLRHVIVEISSNFWPLIEPCVLQITISQINKQIILSKKKKKSNNVIFIWKGREYSQHVII